MMGQALAARMYVKTNENGEVIAVAIWQSPVGTKRVMPLTSEVIKATTGVLQRFGVAKGYRHVYGRVKGLTLNRLIQTLQKINGGHAKIMKNDVYHFSLLGVHVREDCRGQGTTFSFFL